MPSHERPAIAARTAPRPDRETLANEADDADVRLLERVGARIRRLRGERGWSIRELADRADVSQRFVSNIETGGANVSVQKLHGIATALGLQVYELLRPAEPSADLRRLDRYLAECSADDVASLVDELGARTERPIVALLGMRGAGKSTVGAALAEHLGMRFVELDQRIEARGAIPLADIFSMHGPEYYEELERDCVAELLAEPEPAVVATGGGLVTHESTWTRLRHDATCVWLRARPQTHWQRVIDQGDLRPMANNPRAYEQLQTILAQRIPLYAMAHATIDTDELEVAEVVERVAAAVAGSVHVGRATS